MCCHGHLAQGASAIRVHLIPPPGDLPRYAQQNISFAVLRDHRFLIPVFCPLIRAFCDSSFLLNFGILGSIRYFYGSGALSSQTPLRLPWRPDSSGVESLTPPRSSPGDVPRHPGHLRHLLRLHRLLPVPESESVLFIGDGFADSD